jgi:glycosyltransferase involved in cell wall biosynthesis
MTDPRILLIVPCYNEGGSIGQVLEEIAALGSTYHTIVVDDGSTDNTYEVALARSPCVRLLCNLGIGGAVQTGIKYAASRNYDLCVQIDGDGQHPPEQAARLVDAYARFPANIVIGSRYLLNDTFRSTFARRIGSRLIARSLMFFFHSPPITDPTSGMRLMDRKAMALFTRHYPYDFPEPISLAWAMRAGLTVAEAPVQMRARECGRSSIIGLKPFAYMIRVLGYILLARLKRRALV